MSTLPPPQPVPPRPPVRRRASAFRAAQHAAWLRRRATRIVAIIAVALVAAGAFTGAFVVSGIASLPNASAALDQPLPSDTLVYDRTGQVLLADLHPSGRQHYQLSLAAMGRYLPEATVAVEDAGFWNEPGVDPLSIVRAAWTDVRAGAAIQGGSTITQQLVKQRVVGNDATFSRKLREAVLAMRVSAAYSKRQILAMYLNGISYGNTAYGAGAAARIYFHKDAAQLDLAQAALLAGLPQNPTLLNPLTHWDAAKQRQREVLDAMVRTGDVTREQADTAYAEDLSPPNRIFGPSTVDLAPGFVSYVSGQLAARFGRDAVQGGGLRVITSLDWGLQQLAQRSVTDTVRANRARDVTDGALVALDPGTGQVLAMVGSAGPDFPGGQYNMATGHPRNPGSSFKVFTYTAAIDSKKYTMVTPITDAPLTVDPPGGQRYTPKNYDLRYHGVCQLQACLGNSLNVPAVEVELGTGVPNVVEQARRMGAPPLQDHDGRYTTDDAASSFGPSLTLGGYGETPLQMATGVSVLASGGTLHSPQPILSVTGADGGRVFQAADDGQRVLDAGTAYIVSQMLSDDANRAMIFGEGTPLTLTGRRAAAKTGTTDDFADGWTVGYTPSLATAVWMGNTDFHHMVRGSDGIYVAAPAWHEFMDGALDHLQKGDEWYQVPSDVDQRTVNGRSAYLLSGTSPSTRAPALPSWAHLGGDRFGGSEGTDPGSRPGCRTWTYNGGSYWSCNPGPSGLPGDPEG
ncbi:MAG TPA: transglycosylase domain-containing protein [Candidatus Dormibacteraeota bacterium]|jgi:membrane peptidoglycan carboxypeptidase